MRSGLICLTVAISIIPAVANAQLTIDVGNITCGANMSLCRPNSWKNSLLG
jgi:hypothetical protein